MRQVSKNEQTEMNIDSVSATQLSDSAMSSMANAR
jgi:hypothetical protein